MLFLYKINKIWSKQENDEYSKNAKKYENWIKKQVLAVCDADEEIGDFGGWFHGSYLNVGEVAYGVSLTYNWMYEDLTEQERKNIERAIIKYSINVFNEEEFRNYFIPKNKNESNNESDNESNDESGNQSNTKSSLNTNRNQVINSGIGLSALVLLNSGYNLEKVNNQLDENGNVINNILKIKENNEEDNINVQIDINKSIINDMINDENSISDFNDLLYAIIAKSINLQAEFFINKLEGGGYPEGLSYYRYGMSFTNYFISSLYNLSETDFDIMNINALYDSLLYPVYLESGSDKIFNYGDVPEASNNINNVSNTRMIWMANYYISKNGKNNEEKAENAYLLYNLEAKYNWNLYNMIWYKTEYGEEAKKYSSNKKDFLFNNIGVAVLNKNFKEKNNDIYIASKGGKVQQSHGDLDLGSFVLDALGERWIEDFGLESYTAQNINNTRYGRWNYYKKRAEGHSTLVINPKNNTDLYLENLDLRYVLADQYIYANTSIDEFVQNDENSYVKMNLSDAYKRRDNNTRNDNEDKFLDINVTRTIGVYENRSIAKITDVIRLDKERTVYSFLNIANDIDNIELAEDNQSAILTKNGKKLRIELNTFSKPAKLVEMPKVPLNDFLKGEKQDDEGNYKFAENLAYKDYSKLCVQFDIDGKGKDEIKNAVIEIKFIPVYIYNIDVVYEDIMQNGKHCVIAKIKADERMQEVDGWQLSEDKQTLTKTYIANTNEEIKIKDLAGNEITKKIEITNIDHGGLASIEKIKAPAKISYIEGEDFQIDGIEIKVTYNDGISQIINSNNLNLKVINGEKLTHTREKVTISYTENGITKTAEQIIQVIENYNINYELYGGTNSENNPKTYITENEIELKAAEKEGYIFGGWYENSEYTGEKVTNISNRTGNITLYAKWIQYGDINGDGNLNVIDLLLLKRHIIAGTKENWKLTGDKLKAADLNNDNKINIIDLLLLKRMILQMK